MSVDVRRFRRHFDPAVELLRQKRLGMGMSAAALASAIGKSSAWLAQREGGYRKLKEPDRRRIEEALTTLMTQKSSAISTQKR